MASEICLVTLRKTVYSNALNRCCILWNPIYTEYWVVNYENMWTWRIRLKLTENAGLLECLVTPRPCTCRVRTWTNTAQPQHEGLPLVCGIFSTCVCLHVYACIPARSSISTSAAATQRQSCWRCSPCRWRCVAFNICTKTRLKRNIGLAG